MAQSQPGKLRITSQKMKVTFLQVDEAFTRVVWGESGRAVARSLGITEAGLRYHFKKRVSPRYVREVAIRKAHADTALAQLDEDERAAVKWLVARGLAERNAM